ncbi:hypothetical protein [Motilimonas sp. KMU-193]|uniref:hypothetical protein n=1 Tax=Motilimonas sp. KMU-193 TaxID=3388668 RepID=UPI00396B0432
MANVLQSSTKHSADCALYLYQGEQLLEHFSLSGTGVLNDEQQTNLTHLAQRCQTAGLQLIMLFDASHACQALLDLQFTLLQQVYRPLMRSKGAQVWVVWHNSTEMVWREGALALCQVAAMELAAKQVTVNFLCQHERLSLSQLTPLLTWPSAHYCTAQALVLPPYPAPVATTSATI